jgi:hypothetical protein
MAGIIDKICHVFLMAGVGQKIDVDDFIHFWKSVPDEGRSNKTRSSRD